MVGCGSGSWLTILGFEVELKDRMAWNDREAKSEVREMDDMIQNNWKRDQPYTRCACTGWVDDCIVGGFRGSGLELLASAWYRVRCSTSTFLSIRSSQLQPRCTTHLGT